MQTMVPPETSSFAVLSILLLGAASVAANTTSDANASSYSSSNSSHSETDHEDAWSWFLQMLNEDKSIFSYLVFLPPGMRIVGDWFVKTVTDKVKGTAAKAFSTLQAPLLEVSQAAFNGEGIDWCRGSHLFIRSGHKVREFRPENPPKGCTWEWKDDTDGWVAYLPKGIDGWVVARKASGWGHRTAVVVAIAKLLLWHLLQPAMYSAALYVYWDTLGTINSMWYRDGWSGGGAPRDLALIILIREVLYIVSCIVGLWIAPYYLLVHPAWKTGRTKSGSSRQIRNIITYALTPEKFVLEVIILAWILAPSAATVTAPSAATVTESAATPSLKRRQIIFEYYEYFGNGRVTFVFSMFLDLAGLAAIAAAKIYKVTPFPLIVGYVLSTISFFAQLFVVTASTFTDDFRAIMWREWFYFKINQRYLTRFFAVMGIHDFRPALWLTRFVACGTLLLPYLTLSGLACVDHVSPDLQFHYLQVQDCNVDGHWTDACRVCMTSLSLHFVLGVCATPWVRPCCMECLKTFRRVVCMLLRDEDVGDADEVERIRCSQRVKEMLQMHEQPDTETPMTELELWTLLESVNSVAHRSEGGLKTAAMGRREKLAASMRARLLCAEAQRRLVRARDAAQARKIVKDLKKELIPLTYITCGSDGSDDSGGSSGDDDESKAEADAKPLSSPGVQPGCPAPGLLPAA